MSLRDSAWANPKYPCIHSDPVLPDAAPGQTVSVTGRNWFCEGDTLEKEMRRGQKQFTLAKKRDGK